ncbi:MAG TPA: hypothetical protein VMZ27_11325 [Candidatus Saccharimonadales bacterium]|nr:hypothetical protein [Candidatus Saccharimonadales bacterium]
MFDIQHAQLSLPLRWNNFLTIKGTGNVLQVTDVKQLAAGSYQVQTQPAAPDLS